MDRTEFLRSRKTGIGGSDVAAILGLSKYKTALDIYNDKIATENPEDNQSQAAYFGSILEDVVAKEFSKRTGMKIQKVNQSIRAGELGWMIANIDRGVVNTDISGTIRVIEDEQKIAELGGRRITTDAILECKTANQFMADHWGPSQEDEINAGNVVTEHKIPIYYETQVQWYLGVTGARVAYVAVLLGGSDFRIYQVIRDNAVIEALQSRCHDFWFEHVLKNVPPEVANIEDVLKMFPNDNGDMQEATNEQATDIGELRTLSERMKELKAQEEVVKARLITSIGESTGLLIAGEKACTYKHQSRNTFDSTRFKKEQPDQYNKYIKTSETRVFRLAD